MQIRITPLMRILTDDLDRLHFEEIDFEAGERPKWSHTLLSNGSIQSLSEEYRDWLMQWQDWGQPKGKREWMSDHKMNVRLET